MSSNVRVRFAPSPTGYLHVGGARTALFNWLFARHHGGSFVLRVEDTDRARNRPEYTQAIYDGMRWLGLVWDEGPDRGGPHAPYMQSERSAAHSAVAQRLLATGRAYECWCGVEQVDETENEDGEPDAGAAFKSAPLCLCAKLSSQDKAVARERGAGALRMAAPTDRSFDVEDIIRGKIVFPPDAVGDFVLVTSDGRALYNLAVVVDDHDMAITHVIRGEEHLANTPKQQLIYEAMGWKPPRFAHLPIILNAQRRKLSKRDGATSLHDYQAMGYVPDAVVNFLALLGWSPGDNREVLTREDLVQLFDLGGVVKHPAIFDTGKLGWMNKEYIRAMEPAMLADRVIDLMGRGNGKTPAVDFAYVERVAALFRERVRTVVDVLELGSYFFTDGQVVPSEEALAKYCTKPEAIEHLRAARVALTRLDAFDQSSVERAIRTLAAATGVKASEYIHPLRVAVTGQAVSPGIFEVCAILGRDRVLQRIDGLLHLLEHQPHARAKATQ